MEHTNAALASVGVLRDRPACTSAAPAAARVMACAASCRHERCPGDGVGDGVSGHRGAGTNAAPSLYKAVCGVDRSTTTSSTAEGTAALQPHTGLLRRRGPPATGRMGPPWENPQKTMNIIFNENKKKTRDKKEKQKERREKNEN